MTAQRSFTCVSQIAASSWTPGLEDFSTNETRTSLMNEHYGVEPNAFESASDLHLLLNHFGPYCGRYVAELPSSWREQVRRHIERLPVVEAARAKRRLQLAEQCRSLVPLTKGVQQETQDDWLQLFQAAKRQESELRGPI